MINKSIIEQAIFEKMDDDLIKFINENFKRTTDSKFESLEEFNQNLEELKSININSFELLVSRMDGVIARVEGVYSSSFVFTFLGILLTYLISLITKEAVELTNIISLESLQKAFMVLLSLIFSGVSYLVHNMRERKVTAVYMKGLLRNRTLNNTCKNRRISRY